MPRIGVFWFYNNIVIGRSIDLESVDTPEDRIIDSPDTHTDLWDHDRTLLRGFPELYGTEYFSIPRGRVMWEAKTSSAKIFMDSVLFKNTYKRTILKFFDLESTNVQWGKDAHYTTNANEIDVLFDD